MKKYKSYRKVPTKITKIIRYHMHTIYTLVFLPAPRRESSDSDNYLQVYTNH